MYVTLISDILAYIHKIIDPNAQFYIPILIFLALKYACIYILYKLYGTLHHYYVLVTSDVFLCVCV